MRESKTKILTIKNYTNENISNRTKVFSGGKSWDYLETESTNEEEIKKLAIDIVKKSYQKNYDSPVFRLSAPEKPKPTIYIKEYKVKGGLSFTTKWR